MTGRVQSWIGGAAAGAVVVTLVVYLAVVGLDAAVKWASVLGLFVALAGLAVSVAGMRRERQGPGRQAAEHITQSVEGSAVGSGIAQVLKARGHVRIKHRAPAATQPLPPPPAAPPAGTPAPAEGGQSVRGTTVAGSVDQVRDTGGVEIEEEP